jgi:hypothetical protein
MGNVLLTNYCNRRCKYCFAQEKIAFEDAAGADKSKRFLSLDDLEKVIRFFKRSASNQVGLLGGEPTLHPDFPHIIDRFLSEGFRIKLFSNGLMPAPSLEYLSGLDSDRMLTIINVNHPDDAQPGEREQVAATLAALKRKAALGFNIYRPDFDGEFLIDLLEKYDLDRHIRLGLTQPILGGRNTYVLREHYPEVGRRIVRLAERTGPRGMFLGLDCGFTLCMFTPEDIGPMMYNGVTFKLTCNPIVDIGVDLSVWSCFPLSRWETTHLDQFETRQEIVRYYENKLQAFRGVGATADCLECRHKLGGNCLGGCIAQTIASFTPALRPSAA